MTSEGSEAIEYRQLRQDAEEAAELAMGLMEKKGLFDGKAQRYIDCSRADLRIHFRYVMEAIQAGSPSLFLDYVEWNRIFFNSIGLGYIVSPTFIIIDEVIRSMGLAEAADSILGPGLEALKSSSELEADDISDKCSGMGDEYSRRLLEGDREGAWAVVRDALERDVPILEIYRNVFQACLRQIGVLWQTGKISVAKEHLFTSSTQTIMARLYPKVFASAPTKGKVVAACVSGELHEMGIRMIADILELEGYDTLYLGANTPSDSVVEMIAEVRPGAVLLSATMVYHIGRMKGLIDSIRSDPRTSDVKIFVGGRPFLIDGSLWQRLGADGFSSDMEEAVKLVDMSMR